MRVVAFACVVSGLLACVPKAPAPGSLQTTAEATDYRRTGRYAEAVRLCRDFARSYRHVGCAEIGTTLAGRPIMALVIERDRTRPTILLQAGIHAGEIEGKDAGFVFLRDLLDGKVASGALDAVNVVFVPVMNPDGHEQFTPNHRPNQRGPEEMGFRTNAARLNLNRDWVKADAPETQAVLRMIAAFDPVVFVDLHTTDGAKFQHDVSVNVTPVAPRDDGLDELAADLSKKLVTRLTALGHDPVDFYPSFIDDERPHSGFAKGEAPVRFSHAYMATRGRLAVLVETHSWRTYKERARSAYDTLQALFEQARASAQVWRTTERDADRHDATLGGTEVPLIFKNGDGHHDIAFHGYAYERRLSDITGGTWLVYDETTPETWTVPLYDQLVPAITVSAPQGGYVVEAGFATQVAAVLDRHGIAYTALGARPAQRVEVFRATSTRFLPPYEGRTRVELAGSWTEEARALDRGALFVSIRQPKARLILHLFEPSLPDSLARWGLFSAVFEHKEYLEPYVVEEFARTLFAAHPALRAALDEAGLASPEDRLAWIAKHHPAWDERVNLLPVFRTDDIPR